LRNNVSIFIFPRDRFEATTPGDSNGGHDYGTKLTAKEKRELIDYLKTL
jgi:hypothetical protein